MMMATATVIAAVAAAMVIVAVAAATVIVAVAAAMTHAQADATEAAEGDVCLPPPQDANASARSARLRS